jgi:hypothetical protein
MGFFHHTTLTTRIYKMNVSKSFLMSDGTTKDGQKTIAEYYQVQDL